jgi:hypothetical protein
VVQVVFAQDGVEDVAPTHVVQLPQRGHRGGGSLGVPYGLLDALVHGDDGTVAQVDHGAARQPLDRQAAREQHGRSVPAARLTDAVPDAQGAGLPRPAVQ